MISLKDFINDGYRIISYTIKGNDIDTLTAEKYGITVNIRKDKDNKLVAVFDYYDIHMSSILYGDIISHINKVINDILDRIQYSADIYSKLSKVINDIDFKDLKVRITVGDYIQISIKNEGRLYAPTKESIKEFIKETIDKLQEVYDAS